MSGERAAGPCGKFQPNIFNRSRCQNCFKPRELHLLSDQDRGQAKPIYGGWLCLAPVGTDFNNPMQRSRKWQRRFFILYEHGSLSFALDELPSTLPQGTVNMNLCTDIADAEPRTGQRNALCIVTPEQEVFIRGDSKEIINGWSDQLAVYLRTNKQNQKKKRKVDHMANQEPSPPKMAATDPSFPSSEGDSAESGRWREDQQGGGPDVTPAWTVAGDAGPPGPERPPAGNTSPYLIPVSRGALTSDGTGSFGSRDGSTGSSNQLAEANGVQTSANKQSRDRSRHGSAERLLGLEATRKEEGGGTAISRKGRSDARTTKREKLQSCGDIGHLNTPPPPRRAKSLDRRTSDTVMTPDLLNFKKGWMVRLDENEQWKKYWFVLSADSLRYYRDSFAEEASDLEGEIDLAKCFNVSEYQVQRNYGFQIHTLKGIFTLSAMTAGIRKNWIQALMKNVHPANAPDVASLPGRHVPCSPPEVLPKPDVTQDSPSPDVPTERDPHPKPRGVTERRREGRYKTFDWAEFRPQKKPAAVDPPRTKSSCSLELGDLERRRRREERRRRYESMLGFSLGWEEVGGKTVDGGVRALSPKSQQRVEEEIEACWRRVETSVLRLERTVPLVPEARGPMELEQLLHSCRTVEDLKVQLAESERRRVKLEAELAAAAFHKQQLDHPLCPGADLYPPDMTVKKSGEDAGEQPPSAPQLPSIWLHDAEGNLQELEDLEAAATPLLSPASDSELSQNDGLNHQLDTEDSRLSPSSQTQTADFSSLIVAKPAGEEEAMVRRLSQEVELLTSQNEALNQRNQEMLNQLTEADREIERLKAELSSRYTEPRHLPEVEQQGKTKAEDLERELSRRSQELLEAQTLIASLEENLREVEALVQLNERAKTQETGQDSDKKSTEKAEGYLRRCFEATEAKLTELERQLDQSELTCRELQQQNTELKEAETRQRQRAAEAEADVGRLNEGGSVSGEEKIQKVIEGMVLRLRAVGRLVEVIDRSVMLTGSEEEEEEEEESLAGVSQLRREEEFWSLLLDKLKEDPSSGALREVTEQMMLEKRLLLIGHRLLLEVGGGSKGMCEDLNDVTESRGSVTTSETTTTDDGGVFGFNSQLQAATQMKISLLNRAASSDNAAARHELQLAADRLYDFHFPERPRHVSFIHSAATEALYRCQIRKLQSKHRRGRCCSRCVDLTVENSELRARLSNLKVSLSGTKMDSCCQTAETQELQSGRGEEQEEETTANKSSLDGMEVQKISEGRDGAEVKTEQVEEEQLEERLEEKLEEQVEKQLETELEEQVEEQVEEQLEEQVEEQLEKELEEQVEVQVEEQLEKELEEQVEEQLEKELEEQLEVQVEEQLEKELEEQVEEQLEKELEEQLEVQVEEQVEEWLEEQVKVSDVHMKQEFDGWMSRVQTQHEREMEKLKATCKRGLASMEESHLRVVEELQRRHQQEVERLLVQRDRLLEEESAATAIAIEAIKNAHRLELQREVERRYQSENGYGNTHLDHVHQQHSEELTSYQRELQVLSQQFSLKCLENGHLVQALDAERKALCQCQQENQDLRTRNQELSGHLAAEITRLCSLAKQDALPLSQGMDVYEMEITLRVKESEVQCLKQEITSLKEEVQLAQRDKKNATKKYKDMYTELSIVRAKAEQDADELRENLRLAHQALGQTSP